MPELAECRIMADFINKNVSDKKFIRAEHIGKGNKPEKFPEIDTQGKFTLKANSYGKEIFLTIQGRNQVRICIFMGMSGNWKICRTSEWNQTKFCRLRFDMEDGNSLILYGGYLGPKYIVGSKFKGGKRGFDPTLDFEKFKKDVLDNLDKPIFKNPICDVLLNQRFFNGIGNYLRSSILFYANQNPFELADVAIKNNPEILKLCREIPLQAYKFHGGQLRDWINPLNESNTEEFDEWVFYQKGNSCQDKSNRTFWFDPKWTEQCPYKIKNKV